MHAVYAERMNKADMLAQAGTGIATSKIVARNTLLFTRHDGTRVVQFHRTPILTFYPTGMIDLDTGGWNTKTTRERLNTFLPHGWRVYTERGVLYLSGPHQTVPVRQQASILPGDRVYSDTNESAVLADRRRLDRFMAHVRKVGLPTAEQSQGDPWILHPAKPGETAIDSETAWDWIDSLYMTRTLYALSLTFAGMSATGVSMLVYDRDRKGGKLDATDTRRIRRYLRACVGMER